MKLTKKDRALCANIADAIGLQREVAYDLYLAGMRAGIERAAQVCERTEVLETGNVCAGAQLAVMREAIRNVRELLTETAGE